MTSGDTLVISPPGQANIAILQEFYEWLTGKGHAWKDIKIIEDNLRDAGLSYCYMQDVFIKCAARGEGENLKTTFLRFFLRFLNSL